MSNEVFYFDAIIANVSGTSKWRRKQALTYSADKRNLRAAEELERLALYKFSDVSGDAWAELVPYLQSDIFIQAVNEATKNVSFRSFPKDVSALIRNIATNAKAFGLPASIGGAK